MPLGDPETLGGNEDGGQSPEVLVRLDGAKNVQDGIAGAVQNALVDEKKEAPAPQPQDGEWDADWEATLEHGGLE